MTVRQQLIAAAEDMLHCVQTGSIRQAEGIATLPTSIYSDPDNYAREQQRLFRRVPLMLAASCEVPEPGRFKTLEVAQVPVLITRGKDGRVRTFLNSCTHRGARLADGCGHAQRFTCPYHAWSFGADGRLLAVASRQDFGEVDFAQQGLVEFPSTERAGLIWAILNPDAPPQFDAFLHGMDQMLAGFGFQDWSHFRTQSFQGANWKLAFDAHMDFYHLPVLHRNTFGAQISNLAQYYYIGPHQRLGLVNRERHPLEMDDIAGLADLPQDEWPMNTLLFGEWIIFPNISINCFYKGGRGVIISQILPGPTVGESTTVQIFLHENPPVGAMIHEANDMADFLGRVVGEEDLPMSREQQKVMDTGLLPRVTLGRNEGGLQHFHAWIDRFLAAPETASLDAIMAQSVPDPS
ncbi:MAG: hypothetical protein RIS94_2057 [Pseudomonadota bacterium]|jgi:phenylpropionate dioxygenase-like ring-hydroxylating dioxygenase large terminal subunit